MTHRITKAQARIAHFTRETYEIVRDLQDRKYEANNVVCGRLTAASTAAMDKILALATETFITRKKP